MFFVRRPPLSHTEGVVLLWVGICVQRLPDDCWSIFLHIADIMVPVQEKVWSSVRKVACLLSFLSFFLFVLSLLDCVLYDYWQHISALLFWCCVTVCVSIAVLFGSLNLQSVKSLYLERFDLFLILSTILAVECKVLVSLCRHQPGSAPLPGEQSHRGRLWSSVCPQHQPRLLTSALWVCQRTGAWVRLSVCSPSYFLCFVIIKQLLISLQQKVVKDKSKQWLSNKWKH